MKARKDINVGSEGLENVENFSHGFIFIQWVCAPRSGPVLFPGFTGLILESALHRILCL